MFNIGDYAVCPGHGVGQICDIEEREFGEGEIKSFYITKIVSNGMTVMIPTDTIDGIRKLVTIDKVDEVYDLLGDHDVTLDMSTWNRRYRDYINKIKTGSLLEIADVLRSLFLLKMKKNLSFGEKKMLEQCRDLISEEVALLGGSPKVEIDQKINSFFDKV